MRRGGGVGLIVVLIAAAIVMILAMRSWLSVAPTAYQIMNPGATGHAVASKDPAAKNTGKGKRGASGSVPDHGQAQAADQVQRGVLPDLQDMKDGTDQHTKAVEEAMKQSDR